MDQPVQAPAAQPAGGQPDPKAMQIYQRLSLAAMKIIYDPKTSQGLVQTMKTAGDPAAAVAHAASLVLGQLAQQAKGIPPAMVNIAAPVVVAMLFELAHAAGLFKATPELVKSAVELIKQSGQQQAAAPAQPAPQQPAGIIGNAMPAPATVQ